MARSGNKTTRRGRGFPPKRLVIKAEEGAALRVLLMDRHGYSAEEAIAGLLSGELATVLLYSDDRQHAISALEASGDSVLRDIARQLRRAQEREREEADRD